MSELSSYLFTYTCSECRIIHTESSSGRVTIDDEERDLCDYCARTLPIKRVFGSCDWEFLLRMSLLSVSKRVVGVDEYAYFDCLSSLKHWLSYWCPDVPDGDLYRDMAWVVAPKAHKTLQHADQTSLKQLFWHYYTAARRSNLLHCGNTLRTAESLVADIRSSFRHFVKLTRLPTYRGTLEYRQRRVERLQLEMNSCYPCRIAEAWMLRVFEDGREYDERQYNGRKYEDCGLHRVVVHRLCEFGRDQHIVKCMGECLVGMAGADAFRDLVSIVLVYVNPLSLFASRSYLSLARRLFAVCV